MNATDPLAGLRPLHIPEPVGWWPPAPGWWLAGVLLLALCTLLGLWVRRRLRAGRYRRAARRELGAALARWRQSQDDAAFARDCAGILRRAALCAYPRQRVAPLAGEAWLRFLEQSASMQGFLDGAGRVLAEGVYTAAPACDPPALERLCRQWLGRHR